MASSKMRPVMSGSDGIEFRKKIPGESFSILSDFVSMSYVLPPKSWEKFDLSILKGFGRSVWYIGST